MSDTSLISSGTASQTPSNTAEETPAENTTPETPEGGELADKIYDHETSGEKKDPKPEDNKSEGDKAENDKDDKSEGDKAKDKDDKPEDDKSKDKEKDDKKEGEDEDDKDDKKGEPLDLSDIDVELPEGMELNQEAMGDLGTLAGELGLDKETATKFVPIGVKLIESAMNKQQEQYQQTRSEWAEQVAVDKEIGGADEAARKEKLAIASKGLDAIGTPELRTLLDATGLGDNPEVIRAFYKAGLAASEDSIETGGSGNTTDSLDALYPTMDGKK